MSADDYINFEHWDDWPDEDGQPPALSPEKPVPCPELGCGGTLRRKVSRYDPARLVYACDKAPVTRCTGVIGCAPDGSMHGVPAPQATRHARILAHAAFDPLWRGPRRRMTRSQAYRWLSMAFGRPNVHIANLDGAECHRVVELCEALNPTTNVDGGETE